MPYTPSSLRGRQPEGKLEPTRNESFRSALARNLSNVVRSLPQLPSAMVRELNEAVGYFTGASQIQGVGRFLGQRVPGEAAESVSRPAPTFADTLREIQERKSTAPIAEVPGVRLLPGAFTASRLGGGGRGPRELLEEPGYTLLDLLPFVSRAGKVATRGTALAESAAERARLAGRAGKATRIGREGLRLHEIAAQAGRELETILPERARPSGVLQRQGLGAVARGTAKRVAEQEALYRRALSEQLAPVLGRPAQALEKLAGVEDIPSLAERFGVSTERMRVLSKIADEGDPRWRDTLAPNEVSFLDEAGRQIDALTEVGGPLDKTKLFTFRGEVYGPEASNLRKNLRIFQRAVRIADQARIEIQVLEQVGEPIPSKLRGRLTRNENKMRLYQPKVERAHLRTPPARFQTALQPLRRQALRDFARERLNGPDLDQALGLIEEGWREAIPGISDNQIGSVIRGVNEGWTKLKQQGQDPMFVPHVAPDQAAQLGYPKLVTDRLKAPSIEKQRTSRVVPWVPDLEVAISYTAYENLGRIHTEKLIGALDEGKILRTFDQIRDEARREALRQGIGPEGVQAFANRFINENFDPWQPSAVFPFGKYTTGRKAAPFFLPKGIADVVSKMGLPPQTLGRKLAAGSQELLRTSVLDLNPSYYVGNAITALTRQLIQGNPADLRLIPRALGQILRGEIPPEIARGARMMAAENSDLGRYALAGRTLGRLATEAEGHVATTPSGIRRVFRVRDFLRRQSGLIDDMGRSIAYLGEKGRGLRKGLDDATAHDLALEHAAKVLNGLSDMVPVERAIVRNLLPFYGWYRFLSGQVLAYPFDHPLRASIVTALAREVEDDWHDGLPERFRSYLFFGDPTRNPPGKILGIHAGFAIPETGIASLFSMAGFLARLGPQYQFLFRVSGGDEFGGGPELYPNLRFNPVSGREEWDRPPILRTAVSALVPQFDVLVNPQDLDALRENNPEVYKRVILSRLGIRMPQEIDIAEEISKAQKATERVERQQAREQPKPARTGGYTPARLR